MKIRILFVAMLSALILPSCFSDKGNYDYSKDRGVYGQMGSPTVFIGEEINLEPIMHYGDLKDTTKVSFKWFIGDSLLVSTDRVILFKGVKSGSVSSYLYVTDDETGIITPTYFIINVVSPYAKGWTLLCNQNGKSEIAHVSQISSQDEEGEEIIEYKLFTDIYKAQNNDEELGSEPIKLVEHYQEKTKSFNENELLVIQRGGQGCVELDGTNLQKVIRIEQEFVNETLPANFTPNDIIYLSYINFVWNSDGNLYSRLIENLTAGFHLSAFSNIPVYIKNGLRVDNILYSAYFSTDFVLLFDGLNKRLLPYGSYGATTTGDIGELIFTGTYPPNYIPLNNFGDIKLIYGSSFNDYNSVYGNEADFSMLLYDPATTKYYWQTFHILYKKPIFTVTLPVHNAINEFPGTDLITSNSKFWLLKTRAYLFFTSGVNNDKLYYYDTNKNSIHLYNDFSGKEITSIHPNKGFTELGLGLKDGTFVLFDITDEVFISGQPKVIYSTEGLGEIVDVIYRYDNKATNHWL